jgi:autotransporter-associated beta strand protein
MTKGKLFVKTLGLVALIFSSMFGVNAQTLIAHYPFNNTLAASTGAFGNAVIGTSGSATLGSSSVCTDNINNSGSGLKTPSISSLSTSSFQIDFTMNLASLPALNVGDPYNTALVIGSGNRHFGLKVTTTGKLRLLYNNAWHSNEASITLSTGVDYDIQIQYISGIAVMKVNNSVVLNTTLPELSAGTDKSIFLGDNPGATGPVEACFSNLKIYNNPVAFFPNLTISSSGELGTSGTNWSIVGNELIVTGPASVQASVIQTALLNGNLTIKGSGSPEVMSVTVSEAINYSGSAFSSLTFGTSNNTGVIALNNALNINGNITFNCLNFTANSMGDITTQANSIVTFNITSTYTSPAHLMGGLISGPGSVVKTGSAQLTYSDDNTYTGGTTVSGGNLQLGGGSSTGRPGTGSINLVNSGNRLTFNISSGSDWVFPNLIYGAGQVYKSTSTKVVLTADNTYSGFTVINSGTLQIGNGGTTGLAGTGILNTNSYSLIFNRSDDFIITNTLQGTGNITKNGAGKLTLASTSNTHTGLITISAGTLEFGNGGSGTNFWTSYSTNTQIDVQAGTTFIMNHTGNLSLYHEIFGAGTFIKTGTSTLTIEKDVTIPTFTLNTGTVILASGKKMTISGVLTNNGTLTLQNTATLVQGALSTLAGTGTYNVQQAITGAGSTSPTGRFWYLGSPVSSASSSIFFASNAANVAKKRNEVGNSWVTLTSGSPENLEIGKGYYLQTMANATLTFTGGNVNNGVITLNGLTRTAGQGFEGFNLVCNPYPSYLDWDAVTKTNIGTTMWYRSATSNSSGAMVFDTYVAGAGGIGTNLNGAGVSNLIPPMQSFWVRVNSGSTTGSLTMDNSMRSHFTSINGSVAGLKSTSNERDLFLRMNLLQADKKDQLIVYVNETATNGFDILDGEKMMQATLPQFYTKAGDKKIVINGLNSAKKQQSLPITMELPTTGVHSFMIEDLEISNGLVWLEDKQEEIIQALEPGTVYEFYAASGLNAERFVLHFQLIDDAVPTNVYNEVNSSANFSGKGANVHAEAAGVVVIKLPASTEGVTDIQIRDAAGRIVYTGSTNTLETSVQLSQANGIYYVTLNSNAGVEVRKVFIQQ